MPQKKSETKSTTENNNDAKPDFESIKKINDEGKEFWSARELAPLLGYTKWQNFEGVIKRGLIACEQVGQNVDDHFTGVSKLIKGGKGAGQLVRDFNLSRFAAYLIAQNGDPRKAEIAHAQTYFAASTRENELNQLGKRLETHHYLTQSEKQLEISTAQAGVPAKNFDKFMEAGYQGLYGGLTQADIKARKGISQNEELKDRMGIEEMAANLFRNTQANRKILTGQVNGEQSAKHTHEQVGGEIRDTIKRIDGVMPEDLAAEPSLKALLPAQSRRARKNLRAKDSE
jgi:DNA-damage-inducible protein D